MRLIGTIEVLPETTPDEHPIRSAFVATLGIALTPAAVGSARAAIDVFERWVSGRTPSIRPTTQHNKTWVGRR